jgi:peptidyl-prolyl cis-trans isomerase SurA
VISKKAVAAAQQRASAVAAQAKSGDINAAAKAAGVEAKTTDFIARGAVIADAGVSPAVDAAAFALPVGGVSDPIQTDNGAVIVKVLERQEPPATELASTRDTLKTELLNEKRNRFFGSYMTKARDRMKVTTNPQLLAQLVG